jgi:PEGA domain
MKRAFAIAILLVPAVARADDVEQAKMYFNAGAQAYSSGRFAVAVSAFDLAYKLAPRPAILFSMAQAEKKQWSVAHQPDVIRSAVRHYHEYLDAVPTGGRRADAAEALAELEPVADKVSTPAAPPAPEAAQSATRLMISSTVADATARIDDGQASETPLMESVTPGKHKVTVRAAGYFEETREVVALAGAVVPAEVALRERPAHLAIPGAPAGDVAIDGRVVGSLPLDRPVDVTSGTRLVSIARNGYKGFAEDVVFERDKTKVLDVTLERTPQRVASFVTMGAGALALVTGGAFVGVALVEQGKAEKVLNDMGRGNISAPELGTYQPSIDLRNDWRVAAAFTLGAGAATLGAGGLLYAFDKPGLAPAPPRSETPAPPPPKPRDMEMSAVPLLGPGTLGAGILGRF